MSRTQDRIRAQAESQGWTATLIEWEPVGLGAEKEGPSGGWEIEMRRGDAAEWVGGYNAEQAIEWIRNLDRPLDEQTNSFACNGRWTWNPGECMAGRGHKGPHSIRPLADAALREQGPGR